MKIINCYQDDKRAEAYAKLGFTGTYYLAYRDLPSILGKYIVGKNALDFGCGTGRSTRFLKRLGYTAAGADIAEDMIKMAREIDPQGDYRLVEDGNLRIFQSRNYDLIMSAFTFDNIPLMEKKVQLFREMGRLLKSEGRIINLVSSPEIYTNEWVSFSTKDFPENKYAKSGDKVKIIITDIEDNRPVEDFIWTEEDYQEVYKRADLEVVHIYKPLANESDPCKWLTETTIAPWTIYILKTINNNVSHQQKGW
ncbi:hypothetical protein JCM14036_25460 [Desulfotomaculum defluvii]